MNNLSRRVARLNPIASKGAVSNWGNGYNLPNKSRLKQIAGIARITASDLINR